MKKVGIFFAGAAIIGLASAFTAKTTEMQDIYVKLENGQFELLEQVQDDGACVPGNDNCEYIQNGSGGYTPIDSDRRWQSN